MLIKANPDETVLKIKILSLLASNRLDYKKGSN